MLKSLQLRDVGPAPSFEIEFSDRLNLFTGDNGLGKTFILDLAWWALTGDWAGLPAWPRRGTGVSPRIEFQLIGKTGSPGEPVRSQFDFRQQEWLLHRGRPALPGLVVYARADGGFSVCDPARNYWENGRTAWKSRPRSYHFSTQTLWNGLEEGDRTLCNGLIRDWVSWQNQPKTSPFGILRNVVARLAPSLEEPIQIGSPVRVSVDDVRDIPTLTMPYGDVPLVHASAGMKRIVNFAYLLTWAWDEHKRASQLRNQEPVKHIALLVDEIESHLYPRWQRTLLPSILQVGKALEAEVDLQILATTHAPLVLASMEPHFDEDRDSLFLFELDERSKQVVLRPLPWSKQGDADAWLTSPIFDLQQARSKEAEEAIEAAKAFIREDRSALPPGLKTKAQIDKRLRKLLGGQDPFLVRWTVSTEAPGK
jgi:hypothetical protein